MKIDSSIKWYVHIIWKSTTLDLINIYFGFFFLPELLASRSDAFPMIACIAWKMPEEWSNAVKRLLVTLTISFYDLSLFVWYDTQINDLTMNNNNNNTVARPLGNYCPCTIISGEKKQCQSSGQIISSLLSKECRAQNIQAPSLHTHVVWRSAWFSIGAVKSINVNVNVNVCVFWCALFVYMCMFQPDKNTTKRCFVFTDSMAIGSIEILYFFDSHTELKFKLYKIVLVFFCDNWR